MKLLKYGIFLITAWANILFAGNDIESRIIININGHDHIIEDALFDTLAVRWVQNTTEFEDSIESKWKLGKGFKTKANIGNRINGLKIEYDDATEDLFIRARVNHNRITFKKVHQYFDAGWWRPSIKAEISFVFDIELIAKTRLVYDSLKIKQDILDFDVKIKNISNRSDLLGYFPGELIILVYSIVAPQFDAIYDDLVGKVYDLFSLTDQNFGTYYGDQPTQIMEDLNDAVPFKINIVEMNNAINIPGYTQTFQALRLDLDFMHGYTNSAGEFQEIFNNPQYIPATTTNTLQYAGFSYLSWGLFNDIRKSDNLTMIERVDTLMNRIDNMGLNQLLIEADWSEIVPTVNSIAPSLHPNQVTADTAEAYMQEIEAAGGWDIMNQLISTVKKKNVSNQQILSRLIVAIGVGHEKRPPQYNGLHMAPGDTVVGTDSNLFIAVPEDVYLYWLKKFTWAVVRKYKNDVNIWQAENELNAAKYTESFNWWRKGNAWRDDSENGFQTRVAYTIYDAIKAEQPTTSSQVVQSFHLFDAARRIKEWAPYYDVIGLHLYPHFKSSYPNLGFLTGEFVWATKRILKYMGMEYKPVWVLETGFAAETASVPNQKLKKFTEDRQAEYLRQAYLSCEQFGANGFNWWTNQSADMPDPDALEEVNEYIGFFKPDNTPKKAYYEYINLFKEITDDADVTLTNQYQSNNINGSFNIKGALNGVISGSTVHLNSVVLS